MTWLVEHWNPVLTLLVSIATLAVVWRYTIITASIERAAQEQAEAAQRPVIVLKIVLRENSMDEAMERISQKHVPQGAQLAVTENYGHFIVKNIGTGPALNLSFDFFPIASKPTGPGRYARRIPYLSPNVDLESPISSSLVEEDCKFTAGYESVSGKKYLTEMILHTRTARIVLLRDDWIFKTVGPLSLFTRIKRFIRHRT